MAHVLSAKKGMRPGATKLVLNSNINEIDYKWLVVSTPLKILVNEKNIPVYGKMFETTNQTRSLGPFSTRPDPHGGWSSSLYQPLFLLVFNLQQKPKVGWLNLGLQFAQYKVVLLRYI